ncbi:MAG: acetate--CoA ligase family protein [Desulfobacterales bacterium]
MSEYRSKKLLKSYGVPVTREALVQSEVEAVLAAETIGYPVALKACSPELMHKSETGCMALNLKNDTEVHEAYSRIIEAVDIDLEGVLVQEMVPGQRELVLGLNRDPQFGPCVMLGLGGVLTEVLNDTAFRVAPFGIIEARDMIEELGCRSMLEHFRGQAAADIDTICRSLVALGKLGIDHGVISEIDINPMIINPAGNLKAADALVVLGKE